MTQEMGDKAVNDSITNQYKTKEMCDSIISEDM